MRIGILGTGGVGQALATAWSGLGHEVCMGARDAANPKAAAWAAAGRGRAHGAFQDAARHGDVVVNCTAGTASLEALAAAGAEQLAGKPLLDVSNPLDFSGGFPPVLSVQGTDSLGEQIQRAFPESRVVKGLNTVTAAVMVDPGSVGGGEHDLFLCGDDPAAKQVAAALLAELGWHPERLLDLGGIEAARGTESYLLFWVRVMGAVGGPMFNISVVR